MATRSKLILSFENVNTKQTSSHDALNLYKLQNVQFSVDNYTCRSNHLLLSFGTLRPIHKKER